MDFGKLPKISFPSDLSLSTATFLIPKWNAREISLVVGSALLLIFLSRVYINYSKTSNIPSKPSQPPAPPAASSASPQTNTPLTTATSKQLLGGKEGASTTAPAQNGGKKQPQIKQIGATPTQFPTVQVTAQITMDVDQGTVNIKDIAISSTDSKPLTLEGKYIAYLRILFTALRNLYNENPSTDKELKPIIEAQSLEELIFFAGLGFSTSKEVLILIKNSPTECSKELRKISFPAQLTAIEDVPWKSMIEKDDLTPFYKQAVDNLEFVKNALESHGSFARIMQKPVRNFIISINGKQVTMETHVSLSQEPTLIVKKLHRKDSELEVARDSQFSPQEKFQFYTEACGKLVEYSRRFPIPKQEEEKQEYEEIPFQIFVEISSQEEMDILWRLGLVPKPLHAQVQCVFDKINPARSQQWKDYESIEHGNTSLVPHSISSVPKKLVNRLSKQEQEQMFAMQLQPQVQNPASDALLGKIGLLSLSILVEQTPFKMEGRQMQQINTDMRQICQALTFPQQAIFLPSSTLLHIFPEKGSLVAAAKQEMEMWLQSYEMSLQPPPAPLSNDTGQLSKESNSSSIVLSRPSSPQPNPEAPSTQQNLLQHSAVQVTTPPSMQSSHRQDEGSPLKGRVSIDPLAKKKQGSPLFKSVRRFDSPPTSPATVSSTTSTHKPASPSKMPKGLISQDYQDGRWIVNCSDNCQAWMKLSYNGKELVLEGLYRLYPGVPPTIASTVVANDSALSPIEKFLLYMEAIFQLHKYSHQCPRKENGFDALKASPVLVANTIEEAELFLFHCFVPQEKKSQILKIRDQSIKEIEESGKLLGAENPQLALAFLGLSTDTGKDEMQKKTRELEEQSLKKTGAQNWSCLSELSYPRPLVYLHSDKFWERLKSESAIPLSVVRDKSKVGIDYERTLKNRLPKEVIPRPEIPTKQFVREENGKKIMVEFHLEDKQLKFKKFEILNNQHQWEPISLDPGLTFEEKLELYMGMVADLYCKELEGTPLNGLPLFEAGSVEEAMLFYHLGFVPSSLRGEFKTDVSPAYARGVLNTHTYPTPLVPKNKDYFSRWIKFSDPFFEGKEFGAKILSDYQELSAKLRQAPQVAEEKIDATHCKLKVECCNSVGKPLSYSIEMTKTKDYLLIEKVPELLDESYAWFDFHILSSVFYAAVRKSFEWSFKGNFKVNYFHKNQGVFFSIIHFVNLDTQNAFFEQLRKEGINASLNNELEKKDLEDLQQKILGKMQQMAKSAPPPTEQILEPNNFKNEEREKLFSDPQLVWLKSFHADLKKYAEKKDFSKFALLVERAFHMQEKNISLFAENMPANSSESTST